MVQFYLRSFPLGVASERLKISHRGKNLFFVAQNQHPNHFASAWHIIQLNVINRSNDRRDKQQHFRLKTAKLMQRNAA